MSFFMDKSNQWFSLFVKDPFSRLFQLSKELALFKNFSGIYLTYHLFENCIININ